LRLIVKVGNIKLCDDKIGSFGFALVSACVVGGKAKCANVGWLKLKNKKCAVEKNKTSSGRLECLPVR